MADPTTAATSKPRVLVADDEQVIANTLAIILNQAGFEARAVFSGEKAVESLESFQPDMLISDVIMTGTPEGVGPVVPGDVMDCYVEAVGHMRVPVRLRTAR